MADKKISEMTGMIASEIANDDDIVISDTSASHTKRAPISELATFFGVNTEGIQDTIGAMFTGGTHSGVSPVYDDPNGVINFTLSGSVTDAEMGHLHGVTSDIQTQIDTKSPIASPTFTGTASAPNPSANTNTTQLATTQYVQGELGDYASDNVTFTNKAGVISQWTNDSNYMTAGSTNTLTNKSGSNSQWTNDEAYIKASTSDTLTNKAISGSGNTITNIPYTAVSGIVDTDLTSVSGSDDELASSKSIKTYVDAQISGIDSLAEANDSNISSPSSGQILVWDGTDSFDNQTSSVSLTGHVTGTANMDASGDVSIATTIPNNTITVNGTAIALGGSGTISSVLQSGGTFTGDVHVQDNIKFSAGNTSGSADLEIYHDTNHSYIADNGSGDLKLISNGNAITFQKGTTETLAQFNTDGNCELWYDNSKKLETTNTGVTVTGTLTATALTGTLTSSQITTALGYTPYNQTNPDGYITTDTNTQIGGSVGADFNDNVKLRWGTGNDLEIYHDGSNGIIKQDSATGLEIMADEFRVQNSAGTETLISGDADGGVSLYHNDTKVVETTANGLEIPDNLELRLGTGADLKIYHNGSQSIIDDAGTGSLELRSNSFSVASSGGTETCATFIENGAVTLYYDNASKLNTASGGVGITGDMTASGNVIAYSSKKLKSDIKTIDNALDKVSQMRGVSFIKDDKKGSGVIAEELEKVAPELVIDGEYKGVAYGNTVGYLIEAIKELKAEIEELKKDK